MCSFVLRKIHSNRLSNQFFYDRRNNNYVIFFQARKFSNYNSYRLFSSGEVNEPKKMLSTIGIVSSKEHKTGILSTNKLNSKEMTNNLVFPIQIDNFIVKLRNLSKEEGKFRKLFKTFLINPDFLKFAYFNIKNKKGNLTKNFSCDTLDGISNSWFKTTAENLASKKFTFEKNKKI